MKIFFNIDIERNCRFYFGFNLTNEPPPSADVMSIYPKCDGKAAFLDRSIWRQLMEATTSTRHAKDRERSEL